MVQKLTISFTDYYYHSVQNGDDDSALKYSNTPSYTGRQPNFQLWNNQSQDNMTLVIWRYSIVHSMVLLILTLYSWILCLWGWVQFYSYPSFRVDSNTIIILDNVRFDLWAWSRDLHGCWVANCIPEWDDGKTMGFDPHYARSNCGMCYTGAL